MTDLWLLLAQFIFRLTFGVAIAMGATPARLVTSGFYRVHLWVLLGLNTFAALAVYAGRDLYQHLRVDWRIVLGLAIAAAALSYIGSVVWLYERRKAGMYLLYLVGLTGLVAAGLATRWPPEFPPKFQRMPMPYVVTSSPNSPSAKAENWSVKNQRAAAPSDVSSPPSE